MFDSRRYAIFATSELDKINFAEVLETSSETVRKSSDSLKTFVKWEGEILPPSIQTLTTLEGPYTHEQFVEVLNDPYWSPIVKLETNGN